MTETCLYRIRATPRTVSEVPAIAAALGVTLPQRMNTFTGDATLCCAQTEPRAWLIISEKRLALPDRTLPMVVDLSDRYACLRLAGADARERIAQGTSVELSAPGQCAQTLFALEFGVFLQRFGETEYRLVVDAPLAPVLRDWLAGRDGRVGQAAWRVPDAAGAAGSI